MSELKTFKFFSEYNIDDNKEKIEFVSRGYKKNEDNKIILYFKNENSYKFVIENDSLQVLVNNSVYTFKKNKKTEALIRNDNYSYKVPVITKLLDINDNSVNIEYTLDFGNFNGEYKITLELE